MNFWLNYYNILYVITISTTSIFFMEYTNRLQSARLGLYSCPVFTVPTNHYNMKVFCIDAAAPEMAEHISPDLYIQEHRVYTVVRYQKVLNKIFYGLQEIGHGGKKCWYRSDRFLPLSDICEIEQFRNRRSSPAP